MAPIALIVDDDIPSLEIMARLTEREGFDVLRATDGARALTALESSAPDLVILDYRLPHYNGNVVLKFIRETPHLAKTFVISVTAHARQDLYTEYQPDALFGKPIDLPSIRDAIQIARSAESRE